MRTVIRLLLAAALLASPLAAAGPAGAARHSCGLRWGSLPASAPAYGVGPVVSARAGRHACFDRLVLDVRGPQPGFTVAYARRASDGEAPALALRGGAILRVEVNAGDPYRQYRWRYGEEMADLTGLRTLREVASGGPFEHHTTIWLGVRARLPFRVFTLPGPGAGSRLVVDVAHRW